MTSATIIDTLPGYTFTQLRQARLRRLQGGEACDLCGKPLDGRQTACAACEEEIERDLAEIRLKDAIMVLGVASSARLLEQIAGVSIRVGSA